MRQVEMTLESMLGLLQRVMLHSVDTTISKRKQEEGGSNEESSRQYSLEEEYLLSSRYPR